jgi:hypothetical protein
MIYKFKSKASGDLIMLGPNGDQMLRLLGREPAPKGIVEVEHMAAAIAALRAAVRNDEAAAPANADADAEAEADEPPGRGTGVSLRQRLWPVIEMLERSLAAKEPVVWGV